MADSDKVILLKIEVAQAQANANVKKLEASLNNLDGRTKEYTLTLKKLKLERAKLSDLRAKSSKSISNHANELKNANKQTGAATSATLEFGRVLSDAPYGIRGVANNLQQLASNLFFMSKGTDEATGKTIGFGGAIKALGKNLLGPAGMLIAFQGIIALFDYFQGGAKKAAGAGEEFALSAKDLSSTLRDLYDTQGDVNGKIDEYIELVMRKRVIAKEDAETNEEIAALDKVIDDAKALMFRNDITRLGGAKRLTKEQIALASKVHQAQSKILEQAELDRLNAFKKAVKNQEELDNLKKNLNAAEDGTLQALKDQLKLMERKRELTSKDSKEYDRQTVAIKAQKKLIEEIEGVKGKEGKRAKVDYFDIKGILEGRGKVLAEINKTNEKIALLGDKDRKSKLIIQREYHLRRLLAVDGENSELIKAYERYYDELIRLEEEKMLGKGKIDGKTPTKSGGSEDEFTIEDGINAYMELQSSMTNFLNGEYDRQLTIEQNKTNALNNELNQRLLNENLSKDERERIQLEIGRNDDKLRKRQEEIERKRFKMQKAINIANALVDTYRNGVLAFGSQLIIGDPSSPLRAQIAQGVALAAGLANVAMIARQKFQSSAGSGGTIGASGGGGGGGEGREFNFNLAGSTQSNQLTQSIASQLNQPIQAYVVSSEITSQQQLDLNISNTATIG